MIKYVNCDAAPKSCTGLPQHVSRGRWRKVADDGLKYIAHAVLAEDL
jgi:hypothetical protein